MNAKSFHTRILIVSIFFILIALILIGKLFVVQVIDGSQYRVKGNHQYATPESDIFTRGNIYFTEKDGLKIGGAVLESGFKVAINPELIKDPITTANAINAVVPIDIDNFVASASKTNDIYEEVAFHLTEDQANSIAALKLPGVSIYQQNWRFYPGGSLASHELGFVAYDGNDLSGRYGLERYYNTTLSRPSDDLDVNFFAQLFSNIKSSLSSNEVTQGDVVTSIEPNVQAFFENELKQAQKMWSADLVGGIIIDPNTGQIISMASEPDFDLNNFGAVTNPLLYANPNVEDVFEFGSVIKPLVMAGALDEGVVTPTTTYDDKGSVVVDGSTIYNFDKVGRGPETSMQDVLNQSLNTGMVFVSSKMGHVAERNYLLAYGIGDKTGIDLPNETHGLVSNLQSPRDLEYATAAFGQGIALTPVEVVKAFTALAHNGVPVTPHFITQIDSASGGVITPSYPTTGTPVVGPAAIKTITQMLVKVVDVGYAQYHVSLPHYSVAAKTGTAQVARTDGPGYYTDQHLHSMFGYFPASNPKFLVFIYIKNPKGVQYAIQSVSPSFFDTVKFLINYYNIPPDR